MVDYYTNFARFGNPNGKDEGLWTPYSAGLPEFMVFNVDGDEAVCAMTNTPEFKGVSPRK